MRSGKTGAFRRLLHTWKTINSGCYRFFRMAVAREKQRAHRKKTLEAAKASSTKLVEPVSMEVEEQPIRQKIKVKTKARSALVQGEGRFMGMDLD